METLENTIDLMMAFKGSCGATVNEAVVRAVVHLESAKRHAENGLAGAAGWHIEQVAAIADGMRDMDGGGEKMTAELAERAIGQFNARTAAPELEPAATDFACSQCGVTVKGSRSAGWGVCAHCQSYDEQLDSPW